MLAFDRPDGSTLVVRITGDWATGNPLPSAGEVEKELSSGPGVRRVAFDAAALGKWDSGLLTFLLKVFDRCSAAGLAVEKTGLPPGVVRLLDLATAVPERKGARREAQREGYQVSKRTLAAADWVILVTSLSPADFATADVLALYRLRWRIELGFKRLKSVIGLRGPPGVDERSARPYVLAHLLLILLLEPLIDAFEDSPPMAEAA